ncbi:hypothetical protein FB446DRAFT_792468, partial [Lentinula raphanica]
MVNDPRFVDISGSTRNIGNPLSWEDRVVGQMMRSHSMKDGKSSSLWHDQGISFDKEGRPHHREGYDGGNKPQSKTQMQVASGGHYPDDSDSDDSSDDSFDGYRPQDESKRSRTPWLDSDSSESEVPHPDDYGYEDEKISRNRKDKKRRKARKARSLLNALANKGHDEYNRRIQQQLVDGIRRQLDVVLPPLEGVKNVKVKQPDGWSGGGNLDEFETWTNSVLNWMVVNRLTGPDGN